MVSGEESDEYFSCRPTGSKVQRGSCVISMDQTRRSTLNLCRPREKDWQGNLGLQRLPELKNELPY